MKLIDLTHTVDAKVPPYPGDPPLALAPVRQLARDGYVEYALHSGMHVGTHVDCPMHLVLDGRFVTDFPLERFCGEAVLIDARGRDLIDADLLPDVEETPVLLVLTGYDRFFGQPGYFDNQPRLTPAFAEGLRARGVGLLGLDMPSPDLPPFAVHKQILRADICIVENLTNLDMLLGKRFCFYAAPLRLRAEGSMVRAFAQIEEEKNP